MTDNSETYRRMCATAGLPWEPRVGDRTSDGVLCIVDNENLMVAIWHKDTGLCWYESKRLIPLFSIEQLLKMLPEGKNDDREHKRRSHRFTKFVFPSMSPTISYAEQLNYIDRFTSVQQLWLAFVMYELHGKKWNGEGWV